MCRAEAGGQVNEPSSPSPAENCWWAWLLRTVSWRVSGIFRIIIVKPLIWKYTERNPLVGGSAWLPAEGLCYLAQPWNNSGSLGRLRVTPPHPSRLRLPAPAPNGKGFEIPAWLQWRITGMGVAGARICRLRPSSEKKEKRQAGYFLSIPWKLYSWTLPLQMRWEGGLL